MYMYVILSSWIIDIFKFIVDELNVVTMKMPILMEMCLYKGSSEV